MNDSLIASKLPNNLPYLWWIRVSAAVPLSVAVFLMYQKWIGDISSIAGCGGAGGCAQVLGGHWSQWFGIPVTALAAGIYALALLLTFWRCTAPRFESVRRGMVAIAVLVLLAAVWFTGILVFLEQTICPYCLSIHFCGILFGVLTIRTYGKATPGDLSVANNESEPAETLVSFFRNGLSCGLAIFAMAVLVVGQLFGPTPDTHEIVWLDSAQANQNWESALERTGQTLPEKTRATFLNNRVEFDLSESPFVGNANGKIVVAEFIDYTCENCRLLHDYMQQMQANFPDRFLIVLVPCPLHQDCNPYFKGDSSQHQNACEYARLALAFWRAAPDKFEEFHDYLMSGTSPPDLAAASAKADELAGTEHLAAAFKDRWIDQRLKQSYSHFQILSQQNPRMPKLLLGGTAVLNGLSTDSKTFTLTIADHFKLIPPSPLIQKPVQ